MGGYITDNFTWPWIFYINVPIGAVLGGDARSCCCAAARRRRRSSASTRVGLALLVIGVSCLQMMLDLGKDRDWFSSSFIVTLAVVAVVSLAFMLAWEMTEKEPVDRLSLFRTAISRWAC